MNHDFHSMSRILPICMAALMFLSCSGPKESIKKFDDVQAMNSQILNYREWIQANEKELNSLESALKPIMKKSLRKDFELHSAISSSMDKMHEAQQYILEKAKTQRKTAALIQREKNIGPDTEIKGTQITYLDDFSAKDSQIRVSLAKYNRNRSDLIKALKKKNKKLVFIADQIRGWKPAILKLQERRKDLKPRLEKLMETAAIEITFDKAGESVELIAEKTEKVDNIGKSLDKIDRFFHSLVSIAKKEAGGNAYVIDIGSEKMKYERRYYNALETYRDHLKSLNTLLPN